MYSSIRNNNNNNCILFLTQILLKKNAHFEIVTIIPSDHENKKIKIIIINKHMTESTDNIYTVTVKTHENPTDVIIVTIIIAVYVIIIFEWKNVIFNKIFYT